VTKPNTDTLIAAHQNALMNMLPDSLNIFMIYFL
jgi:hypothetical protein